MKQNSSFKMKKQYKMYAANFVNAHVRGDYKRAMIHAQLAEEEARRAPLSKKDKE